jgi:hypothetical protein
MRALSGRPSFRPFLSLREQWLALGVAWLALLVCLLPAHGGGQFHSHDFADGRTWLGIPCALDVLSNLPFALLGVGGLAVLARRALATPHSAPVFFERCAALFFAGLLCTSVGSTVYHWRPDDAGLLWDRAAMAVAFAGMLGMAACDRVSGRAGQWLAATSLFAGLLAVVVWQHNGNVVPWAAVQFGGMALVLVLAMQPSFNDGVGLRLGAVVLVYAAAKALEMADPAVFALSGGLVSGHTLKHLVASLAAVPVLHALMAKSVRHNPGKHLKAVA